MPPRPELPGAISRGLSSSEVEFEEALARLGFELGEQGRGVRRYEAHPNRFMTYSVHAFEDGTALLTWEFDVVDYLSKRGVQLGSGEALNTFMFPATDDRGPQDGAWLASALDRAEETLASLRFDRPQGEEL
jgi:hypothetical protein